MTPATIDDRSATSRVVYTCWPFGGVACGVTTMAIGVLLLVDHFFEAAPEVLWGLGLIALGAAVALWHRKHDARW